MGHTLTLIGVEDWHGPAPKTESRTSEDAFDFTSGGRGGETEGLLLPAVQMAAESSHRPTPKDEAPADSFHFKTNDEKVGLPLPAVQAAHGEEAHYYTITLENGTVAGIDDGAGSDPFEIRDDASAKNQAVGDSADGDVTPLDALIVINEIDSIF
ncbi:MAG: hypothetical protein AAFN79_10505 [Pseudomonadota bacterium]